MNDKQRTITSAKVTITVELPDLGTFGPGSLFSQAKFAAAHRLSSLLGVEVSPEHLQIESISTDGGMGPARLRRLDFDFSTNNKAPLGAFIHCVQHQ